MIDGQSMFQSAVNSGNEAERVVVPARFNLSIAVGLRPARGLRRRFWGLSVIFKGVEGMIEGIREEGTIWGVNAKNFEASCLSGSFLFLLQLNHSLIIHLESSLPIFTSAESLPIYLESSLQIY